MQEKNQKRREESLSSLFLASFILHTSYGRWCGIAEIKIWNIGFFTFWIGLFRRPTWCLAVTITNAPQTVAAGVVHTLQVMHDCVWKLWIGKIIVEPSIELLKDCVLHIGCVNHILHLLDLLDDAICCVGNSDSKFHELINPLTAEFL